MDKNAFKSWLSSQKSMSINSSRDVVSRLNRGRIILHQSQAPEALKLDETILYLERSDNFNLLSKYVRSQIKRAFKLQHEFLLSNEESSKDSTL